MFEIIILFLIILSEFIAENIGIILILVLLCLVIGAIIEYIEISCVVLGVISLIACTIMMFKAFDWCFNRGCIGAALSIITHIALVIGFGLTGELFISLLILLIGTVVGWFKVEDCSEVLGMFGIILSVIIPIIILVMSYN